MRHAAAVTVLLMAAVASGAVRAAEMLDPEAVVDCIGLAADAPRSLPAYPESALQHAESGVVMVRLTFAGQDRAPSAELLHTEGAQGFAGVVLDHVRHLRAPCMAAGAKPARADLGVAFVADQRRVVMALPIDPDAEERRRRNGCIQQLDGPRAIDVPPSLLRPHVQGRVLLKLVFTAADQPPALAAFSRPRADSLRRLVLQAAHDFRLPCLDPADAPATVEVTHEFRIESVPPDSMLNPRLGLGFRQLVALAKPDHRAELPLSTESMGCPFGVRLTYRQPDGRNIARQQGDFHPARQPLLDWLARAMLDGSDDMLDAVYGHELGFQVPCYRIRATASNPQE